LPPVVQARAHWEHEHPPAAEGGNTSQSKDSGRCPNLSPNVRGNERGAVGRAAPRKGAASTRAAPRRKYAVDSGCATQGSPGGVHVRPLTEANEDGSIRRGRMGSVSPKKARAQIRDPELSFDSGTTGLACQSRGPYLGSAGLSTCQLREGWGVLPYLGLSLQHDGPSPSSFSRMVRRRRPSAGWSVASVLRLRQCCYASRTSRCRCCCYFAFARASAAMRVERRSAGVAAASSSSTFSAGAATAS
jgi:hypothetical protein